MWVGIWWERTSTKYGWTYCAIMWLVARTKWSERESRTRQSPFPLLCFPAQSHIGNAQYTHYTQQLVTTSTLSIHVRTKWSLSEHRRSIRTTFKCLWGDQNHCWTVWAPCPYWIRIPDHARHQRHKSNMKAWQPLRYVQAIGVSEQVRHMVLN